MSIIKKPYEIAVYDDVLQDNNTFQEVRLGIIGSDKMEGQNRVQEPNFVRNINGQNTLTFKMYKTYTDIVTGEKVDNPFCDWLVSERKVKLHYEDKWYDFIVKDIQEESTNYLYSYSLEDANVQELSRNGFGVILDVELMNNVGDAAALGTEVMKETNWTISGDVAVQTVEEALVYIQTTQPFAAKHIINNNALYPFIGVTTEDVTIPSNATLLGFYSSCKSKPNRFQFIVASNYDTDSNRVIKDVNCQYYMDFDVPESAYGVYSSAFDLYLPSGMVAYMTPSGDTPISTKYRGARYGFAQQAQYVPLLERYCQKFNADTIIPVQYGQLEVYNSYTTNPSATDSIIVSSSGSLATGFSGTINSLDGGVALNIDYNSVDTYFIEFALEKTEGTLNNIGGYCDSFRVESYEVFSDSARTVKVEGSYDNTTDTFTIPSGVNSIYVTAKYHKIVNEDDTTPYIFIQPNKGDGTSVTVTVSNLIIKNKGDYFGYTDSEYVSPTLIQNVINNYNFESDAGWTATYTDQIAGAEKSTVINLFGRFAGSNPVQFKSIVDDFLDGTYSDTNTYLPYMQMDLKNTSHFVLNSGMRDNRTMIKNLSEGEEWVLDYRILNSEGTVITSGLTFDLAEYIYNTSTGGYSKKNDKVVFSQEDISSTDLSQEEREEGYRRIKFAVESNGYTEATFKKSSRIYLKIQSGSTGTYYIQHIALYRLVRDENGNIIEPDYEEKHSAAAQDWIDKSKLNHKYCYFNAWEVNPDNPYIRGDVESLPITTTDTLDYTKYKATYNEDARKVRAVTVKESNYFNILQTIGETFEQWLTINVGRDASGAITSKSISFKNYRGDNNYACFRYGVNLKDITRTFTSKEIVTKLIVKQNSNQLADNGFCTIQRAAANTTGEDYIYDFQYYQNRGLMDGAAYLQQNYYLTSAIGPDAELWGSSGPVQPSDAPNLNGCFPRIKKINDAIIPLNEEVGGLKIDLTQRQSELAVAEAANEAAISGIEEVREDFFALTGVYPEDISEDKFGYIEASTIKVVPQELWCSIGQIPYSSSDGNIITLTAMAVGREESKDFTISFDTGMKVSNLGGRGKKYYGVRKKGWEKGYISYPYEVGKTYCLRYKLTIANYPLERAVYSIGHGSFAFFKDKTGDQLPVVEVYDSRGKPVQVAYPSDTDNSYVTVGGQTGIPNGTYTVFIKATRYDYQNDAEPKLYILVDCGNECDYDVWDIKLTEKLAGDGPVDYDRTFNLDLSCDVYLKENTDPITYKRVERTYQLKNLIMPKNEASTIISQPVNAVDLTRNDVQKYLIKYTTYLEEKQRTDIQLPALHDIVSKKEQFIRDKQAYIKQLYYYKQLINNLFFSKYSRFIQEGTWIDEEYTDDEKYYADALSVLYNSCYPQVAYSINVLELSKLPGYELFKFDVGDKTWAIDDDFFGEGVKEEVIITELSENLDDPSQNNIKVQNFKNQFQDLFQAITATVQQTQYSSGAYEKGAALVDADEDYKSRFIIDAVNNASSFLAPGRSHTVSWEGGNGITVTDDTIPTNQVRIVGGAILFSATDPQTQEQTWVTGVTNEGISANLITAGRLDTGAIQIMSGDEAVFRWDAFGLSAYDAFWQDNTVDGQNGIITGVNTKKFVRFDKFGIYGIDNYWDDGSYIDGATWHPKDNDEIDEKATFALTWQGLKVTHPITNSEESAVIRIGKFGGQSGDNLLEVTKGTESMMSFDEDGTLKVGGWNISEQMLKSLDVENNQSVGLSSNNISNQFYAFWAGDDLDPTTSPSDYTGFRIKYDGEISFTTNRNLADINMQFWSYEYPTSDYQKNGLQNITLGIQPDNYCNGITMDIYQSGTYTLSLEVEDPNIINATKAVRFLTSVIPQGESGYVHEGVVYDSWNNGNLMYLKDHNFDNITNSYTFTINSRARIGITFYNPDGYKKINVKNLKLEYGTKVTPWCADNPYMFRVKDGKLETNEAIIKLGNFGDFIVGITKDQKKYLYKEEKFTTETSYGTFDGIRGVQIGTDGAIIYYDDNVPSQQGGINSGIAFTPKGKIIVKQQNSEGTIKYWQIDVSLSGQISTNEVFNDSWPNYS